MLVQLIIERRGGEWVLLKDGVQIGEYAALSDARAVAGMLAEQARLVGAECELLIHDEQEWQDEPCPESPQALP
jgi:hypothetical protein